MILHNILTHSYQMFYMTVPALPSTNTPDGCAIPDAGLRLFALARCSDGGYLVRLFRRGNEVRRLTRHPTFI